LNLNFLITKKHIFKQRIRLVFNPNIQITKKCGIFSTNKIRFEFVHLKTIKKIFRKKYFKRRTYQHNVKYWVMIKPNFLLTMKSKNSRMGSGVGAYVRVCFQVKPNKPLIFLQNYSHRFVNNAIKYLKLKLNKSFYTNSTISVNIV
jgi:ribosomal protein L16/L10AE